MPFRKINFARLTTTAWSLMGAFLGGALPFFFCIFGAFLLAGPACAQKWTLQYFYDQDGKQFRITGLAFPSDKRGIAVGAILDNEGRRPQFTALVTNDAGTHWTPVPLKEFPRSLFFLNDSVGWMVTSEGIWFTEESGRSWRRIANQIKANRKLEAAPSGGLITRLWFLDEHHGFAVGLQKSVFETHDGGRTWVPVEEAAKPSAKPDFSVYTSISFADARHGMITGGYVPSRRETSEFPEWVEPQKLLTRRQVPLLTFELHTSDGGLTWNSSTAPVFGTVTNLRMAGNQALALFSYEDSFLWPSEMYRIQLSRGDSISVFKRKDRRVTDAFLSAEGRAYLAAIEPVGNLRSAPVPGKVKILMAQDLHELKGETNATESNDAGWMEMDVDYRAVAGNVILAGPDAQHQWAATDTGMILKLESGN